MRNPDTLCCSFSSGNVLHSNELSSLVTYSSGHQLTPKFGMSAGCQSWEPLSTHNDAGQWGTETCKEPTACIQDPSCSKPLVTKGKKEPRSSEGEKTTKKVKKKNYQRYAKPPYSYLAMIALVIQNSPDKMLKLSQILKGIEILFPFFKGEYIGWKDSVRHNLSSNDCFRKVLKDPGKPQAKGNFWTVDVSRIPLDAMKLQNTVMTRGGPEIFIHDLSPYILHNYKYDGSGDVYEQMPSSNRSSSSSTGENSDRFHSPVKLNNSFMIDSLLHEIQEVDLPDVSKAVENQKQGHSTSNNLWAPTPHLFNSSHLLQSSSSPSFPTSQSIYSSSSASVSTMSPLSCDEKSEYCREVSGSPQRSIKRQRKDNESRGSSSDSSAGRCSPCGPSSKTSSIPSELPTSYTNSVPPNVVAPPNVLPFFPFSRYPYYNYGPSPYMTPPYWGFLSQPTNPKKPCPTPTPDLDSMLRAVPPNKSVYDVLMTHPGDLIHPAFLGQYLPSSSNPGQSLL